MRGLVWKVEMRDNHLIIVTPVDACGGSGSGITGMLLFKD